MAVKIRKVARDGTKSTIELDYLPFGHSGGGKASGDVTSKPAGWSEITFTNLIFDQEVDENPTLFDAGGINIAIFVYLIKAVKGITPNPLTNKFYYQQEQVTGLKAGTTRDITGWIGGSIRQSQTSEYDHDIAYWRLTKIAFVDNGKWRVLMLNTDLAGARTAATIINQPTDQTYIGDPTFGAGVFGTRVTQLPATGTGIKVESLDAQTSGLHIGLSRGSMYGLGRYTYGGKLIEIRETGAVEQGASSAKMLQRKPSIDIDISSLTATQGNAGITGDGTNLWFGRVTRGISSGAVFNAFNLSTKNAVANKNFSAERDGQIRGMAIDNGNIMWVSSSADRLVGDNNNYGIQMYNTANTPPSYIGAAPSYITRIGGFIDGEIAIYNNYIYYDRSNRRVDVFDSASGSLLRTLTDSELHEDIGTYGITGMSAHNGKLYITNYQGTLPTGNFYLYVFNIGNAGVLTFEAKYPFPVFAPQDRRTDNQPSGGVIYVKDESNIYNLSFLGDTDPGSGTAYSWKVVGLELVDSLTTPGSDKELYSICKRIYKLKESESTTPVDIVDSDTGNTIPVTLDLSTFLTPDINPLAIDSNVKWSGISHDRQNKLLLTTYNESPPTEASELQGKLIIIPISGVGRTSQVSSNIMSFINGTKTRNANELAFIDEIGKSVHLLDTSDDTWKTNSFALYKRENVERTTTEADRIAILSTLTTHPLGSKWLKNNQATNNPLYSYNEYLQGLTDNLFPRYINNYSMAIEVGEFRSGQYKYEEDTYVYNSFKNTRDWQWDRSHNSTLYDKGRKIQYMHTPTFNASALHTIETGGPWTAITSKRAANSRQELMAIDATHNIHWYYYDGSTVQKRTLPLTGFSLQNVTGIEWIGDNLYVCDSGQYQNQIQKYSVSTTSIAWSKTIANPKANPLVRIGDISCTVTPGTPGTEGTPGTPGTPGTQPQQKTRDKFFNGIYPINEVGEFISGQNYSLRIRLLHSRYLDIGSLFFEASGPRAGPGI